MPPRVQAREEGEGGGGLTVGWVLAIALAGGALLFVSLAFILVTLTDRRNQRARLATESQARLQQDDDASSETETNNDSLRPPRQRRKLTKSPQVSPRKKARRSLPHILPAIKHSGSLNHIFGSPTTGRRRKNSCNSWIDEDAIHGPKVAKAKRESKGFSLRESWLIMRTPTLPNLLGYKDEPDTATFYQHQNYPLVQQPRPVALSPEKQQKGQKATSRMPLVRTPSYEMAEKRAAALRGDFQQQNQQQKQPQQQQEQQQPQQNSLVNAPNGPRPPPKAKLRQFNTESDLQTILRNTAQRLNDGSPSPTRDDQRLNGNSISGPNRATRHVRTPASRGSPVKSTAWNDKRNIAGEYRGGFDQTPSPKKMPVQPTTPQSAPAAMDPRKSVGYTHANAALPEVHTPTHRRKQSTCSIMSDQDSLYGETTPEQDATAPAGLSSPDRRGSQNSIGAIVEAAQQKQQQRGRSMSIPSMTSSVSSALSTLYSEEEEETEGGERIPWAHPVDPNQQRGSFKPRRIMHSPKMSDPFLVPGPVPQVPERSPRRLSASGESQRPQIPMEMQSSQDASRALGQISGNRQSSMSSPIMAPLMPTKDSQMSAKDELRLSIMMEPSQKQGQSSMRPKSVVTMKPKYFATSNSATSMMASPSTPEEERKGHRRRRSAVMPPPLNLRPIQGSPHSEDENNDDLVLPTHNLRTRRSILAAGDIPTEIPSSSRASRPLPDPTLIPQSPTPQRRRSQSTTPSRGPSNASSTYSNQTAAPSPTLILRPQSSINRGSPTHISPLAASIVQLRRMNSQMSAYSVASSTAGDDAGPITDLRGGGFSPDRSSSRAGRAGRQNYLSMGTPSPKSRNTGGSGSGRTIRNARNSVKARPMSLTRMDSVEEKENGESQQVPVLTRGGLKGSLRTAESPKRRLSVRFADVKDQIFVDAMEVQDAEAEETTRGRERTRTPTRDRASADSLGLYDKDGFLMSSPERFPSSVAENRQGGALRI
ncbi:hypothetical protein ACHAQA_005081 [Verticillium albo-atrum]